MPGAGKEGIPTLRVTSSDAGKSFELGVTAEQVPLDRLVALARHTKKDLPEDLTATGSTDAVFTVRKLPGETPLWSGGGRTTRFNLQSKVLKPDLPLGPLEFVIAEASDAHTAKARRLQAKPTSGATSESSLRVLVQPFAFPAGTPSPAVAKAYFDLSQYRIDLAGAADLARLLNIARAMGIATPAVGIAGPAQIDFNIAGTWSGFASPVPSGKIQIHDATVELPGVFEPLQVNTAAVRLAGQSASVSSFTAVFKDASSVSGSADLPLHCTAPANCVLHFRPAQP
jgi:hypothetical protein